MAQQRISFEWVLEDNRSEIWRGAEADGVRPLDRREQRVVTYLVRGMVLLLVVVAAASGAGMSPEERVRREAAQGIAFILNLENQAWELRDRGFYESLFDPNVSDEWEDEWRDVWREGASEDAHYRAELRFVHPTAGLMQATVVVDQGAREWSQTSPYREERFYRRADQRWLRTVPPAEYWGEPRQLETEHLRFLYYARDAAAVAEAAPQLQSAYVEMYEVLGLVDAPTEKQVIEVVPRPVGRWSVASAALEVTSPLLARIPESQSDGDYLAYEIMGWFTYRAVRDSTPNMAVRYLYRWPILVWGLRGWLREDLLPSPSPWRAEAIELLRSVQTDFLPLELSDITELRGDVRPTREQVILRYLAAESFIRFVVETRGRGHLPDLLAALVRYGSWEQIVPQLYGVSVAQFVDDWNQYVVDEYILHDIGGDQR
jgi:hypothetical protein